MTLVCPGSGPSQPIPGLQDNLVNVGFAANFASAAPNLGFLVPLAAVLGVFSYHLPTFCATDPPGYPTFTAQEITDFAGNVIGANYTSFLSKAAQALATFVWYQSCQCVTGPQPTPPTPPAPPAGNPTVFGPPSATVTTACVSHLSLPPLHYPGGGAPEVPTNPPFSPSTEYDFEGTAGGGGGGPYTGYKLPSGCVGYTVNMRNTPNGAVPCTWQFIIRQTGFVSGSETQIGSGTVVSIAHGGAAQTRMFTPAAGQIGVVVDAGPSAVNSTDIPSVDVLYYCGGLPGSVVQPCCPPDQSMILALSHISAQVDLIQRQLAPFAYLTGTVHAALSGSGQFAVQGILGLAVSITTLPHALGAESGDPTSYYGVGWLNVGTADGWGPRQWITSNPFMLRPISGDVTLVGYSLEPGTVITITELVREP